MAFTINDLGPMAIAILTVAVVLGLGASILSSFQTSQTDLAASYGNETLTWTGNNTAMGLSEARVIASSVVLYNNGTLVNQGNNYTVGSNTITVVNTTSTVTWVTSDLNATYSYQYGSYARNSSDYGLTGVTTLASYVPTIALVIIASIVIGIILVFFSRREGS